MMTLIIDYLDGEVYEWKTDDVSNEKGMLYFTPLNLDGTPIDNTTQSVIHIPHCVIRKYRTEWPEQEEEGFIALEEKVANNKDV